MPSLEMKLILNVPWNGLPGSVIGTVVSLGFWPSTVPSGSVIDTLVAPLGASTFRFAVPPGVPMI